MALSEKHRALLDHFEPVASLSAQHIEEVVLACSVEKFPAGATIFREGDKDNLSVYLVSGRLKLLVPKSGKEYMVDADSVTSKYAIADMQPREVTAVAVDSVELLRIPADDLDNMLMRDGLEKARADMAERKALVSERRHGLLGRLIGRARKSRAGGAGEDESEWRDLVLKSDVLGIIPLSSTEKLMRLLRPMNVKAGEVIIRQSEEGDFYYLIAKGSAVVIRHMDGYAGAVPIAELGEGTGFGEEALISNAKRNATITMKTAGLLLRLSKQDFLNLLQKPMVMWLSRTDAKREVSRGAKLLDVRHATDFELSGLDGASSMPLHELRGRADDLQKDTLYICYCQNGRLSSTAAFLLKQMGYKAAVLRGGMRYVQSG